MANIIKIKTKDGREMWVAEYLLEHIKSLDLVPEELSAASISAIVHEYLEKKKQEDFNEILLKARERQLRNL